MHSYSNWPTQKFVSVFRWRSCVKPGMKSTPRSYTMLSGPATPIWSGVPATRWHMLSGPTYQSRMGRPPLVDTCRLGPLYQSPMERPPLDDNLDPFMMLSRPATPTSSGAPTITTPWIPLRLHEAVLANTHTFGGVLAFKGSFIHTFFIKLDACIMHHDLFMSLIFTIDNTIGVILPCGWGSYIQFVFNWNISTHILMAYVVLSSPIWGVLTVHLVGHIFLQIYAHECRIVKKTL